MTTAVFVDYYAVLQVAETADAEQIKIAIRQQRRIWIKRQANADPARRAEAEIRVREIDDAEHVLLDPGTRPRYDQQLAQGRASQAAVAAEPAGIQDWIDRARGYLTVRNYGAAHRAAREATAQQGSDSEGWSLRANASLLLGQITDAEFEYTEAVRLAPDNAGHHFDLGDIYLLQNKLGQALQEFELALQIAPGDPATRTAIAQVLLNTDQHRRALEIMEQVVAEHPGNQSFKYYLAAALYANATDSVTQVRDGRYIATSEAQVRQLSYFADRIAALNLPDAEVSGAVGQLRQLAADGRTVRWVGSDHIAGYIVVLAVLVVVLVCGLGSGDVGGITIGLLVALPLMALIGFVYVLRHRKPGYKHAAQLPDAMLLRRGI